MADDDPRVLLDGLIRSRGADYAGISRLLGRNPAYIQQYIKRGSPRRLDENDRRLLAQFFDVGEDQLGGPVAPGAPRRPGKAEPPPAVPEGMLLVPRLEVRASAGPGALDMQEAAVSRVAFDRRWLRDLASGSPGALSIIRVMGDSMLPTLSDGDEIMVDRDDSAAALRDGIYVLRFDDALVVKRVAVNPVGRTITVRSDNPAYPTWPDCNPDEVTVIGRVVWAGRRIS